jgi:GT2 family glycosyltransferase
MPAGKIQLSIIVLFYHGERWIEGCIQSLENQSLSRSKYEIILVNNGGSTPSVKKYIDLPYIRVLNFPENYGFAAGNNKALDYAEGEFILLMNQDVVVHFNCLEELLAGFDFYPRAAVISANMLMVTSKDYIEQHRPNHEVVGLYRLSYLGYASYFTKKTDKDIVPVEFVSGNALCFRRNLLKDIGNFLFDDSLGSYAEDLDLSIRLKKNKLQMYVRPNAVVYHYRDEAFTGNLRYMAWKLIHVSSNRLLVYYNNFSLSNFLIKLPALLLGIPFKVLYPDDRRKINPFKFLFAFGFVPIIFVYFGLRVFKISKKEKNKSGIPQKISDR